MRPTDKSEARHRLRLFGEPACIVDGNPRRIGGPPRTLALLLFLVVHRRAPLERRRIAFALWPDADEDEALANLRRHLHALVGTLPTLAHNEPWFESSRVSVRWVADAAWTDVTAFEHALATGDDERALAHYGGPLCPAVDEAWADIERDRLARLVLDGLDRLIERDRPRDTQRAIVWATRALAIDPWAEPVVRTLIELQCIAGDTTSARRQYHEFAQRLAREYDVAPAPETTAAYERIAASQPLSVPVTIADHQPAMLGRESELAAACRLIETERLVTIVGHGGIGKTRLALGVGAAVASAFADGVHLCELVSIADPAQVASAIATSAGIAQAGSLDIAATIGVHFGDRLIIIDNCEHVLGETARVIEAILQHAPRARILATSREALHLRVERVLRLQPLETDAAIALFAARAETANPHFRLSRELLPIVGDVCRRLDGNALAIELAAARLNVLSVQRIRAGLDMRFALLKSGKRDVAEHQRALRTSLDWSYDLLEPRERSIFAKLGVFAGLFSLESAVALCSDDTEFDVIETLGALVDKSLVVAVTDFETPRFRLLESVRLYARDQLEAAGMAAAIRTRHLTTIGAAFEAVRDAFAATPRESLLLELAPLLDDARVALDWALRSGPDELACGIRLLCATKLWDRLEVGPEGRTYAQALLAKLGPDTPRLAADLWRYIAFADDRDHMSRTIAAADRSVALAREADDMNLLAAALAQRAFVAIRFRRFAEAAHDLDEAETVAPLTAARRLLVLAARGFLASLDGRLDEAARVQIAVLETHRFLGNRGGETSATMNLAEIEHSRGRTQRAIAVLRPFFNHEDWRKPTRLMRLNLVGYHLALADFVAARSAAAASLADYGEDMIGSMPETMIFGHVALLAAAQGNALRAAQINAAVEERYRLAGMERDYTERVVHHMLLPRLDEALTPDERAAAEAEGRTWSRDRLMYEAQRTVAADDRGFHQVRPEARTQ